MRGTHLYSASPGGALEARTGPRAALQVTAFWLVDLHTGAERQITELAPDIAISDFDLSRDGSACLFF